MVGGFGIESVDGGMDWRAFGPRSGADIFGFVPIAGGRTPFETVHGVQSVRIHRRVHRGGGRGHGGRVPRGDDGRLGKDRFVFVVGIAGGRDKFRFGLVACGPFARGFVRHAVGVAVVVQVLVPGLTRMLRRIVVVAVGVVLDVTVRLRVRLCGIARVAVTVFVRIPVIGVRDSAVARVAYCRRCRRLPGRDWKRTDNCRTCRERRRCPYPRPWPRNPGPSGRNRPRSPAKRTGVNS